jgi:fumarate reductase flavoprotein subunit
MEELAAKLNINKTNLLKTVETYKGYIKAGKDLEFGKTNFTITFDKPNYYGIMVSPAAQGTFGGVKINTSAEVMDTKGNVIPGLYAAGENAGEGTQGASPLTETIVFGKIAAQRAVHYLNQ